MALQAAMIAAPLVMQGISIIGSVFGSRKAKKAAAEQNAMLAAENAQSAKQLQSLLGGGVSSTNASYMAPSGISPTGNGIGTVGPGQLPPFAA